MHVHGVSPQAADGHMYYYVYRRDKAALYEYECETDGN